MRLSTAACLKLVMSVSLLFSGLAFSDHAVSDPMRPPGFGEVSTKRTYQSTKFTLSQILVSDQRKRAVINEQLVSVGDSVDGARVLFIDAEKVTLRVDGRTKTLAINTAKGFKIKRETE
ncbi:hypothetical protein [Litoribrevibacter albus]|nr:hypothetical protein [Litoribrevibacter albus]